MYKFIKDSWKTADVSHQNVKQDIKQKNAYLKIQTYASLQNVKNKISNQIYVWKDSFPDLCKSSKYQM